jgi:hypothetical protein
MAAASHHGSWARSDYHLAKVKPKPNSPLFCLGPLGLPTLDRGYMCDQLAVHRDETGFHVRMMSGGFRNDCAKFKIFGR